jgi:hypothetical protein
MTTTELDSIGRTAVSGVVLTRERAAVLEHDDSVLSSLVGDSIAHPHYTAKAEAGQRLAERLSPEHLSMLRSGSTVSIEVIPAHGNRTIAYPAELIDLGFSRCQRGELGNRRGARVPLNEPDGEKECRAHWDDAFSREPFRPFDSPGWCWRREASTQRTANMRREVRHEQ